MPTYRYGMQTWVGGSPGAKVDILTPKTQGEEAPDGVPELLSLPSDHPVVNRVRAALRAQRTQP